MAFTADSGNGGSRRSVGTLAEINIIPLVDVVLVLLLIFMLTAPLMYRGIDVNLPKTAGKPTVTEERMEVTLTKEQQIYLNGKPVALGSLEQTLRDTFKNRTDKTLYLKAARGCNTGSSSRRWTGSASPASRSSAWSPSPSGGHEGVVRRPRVAHVFLSPQDALAGGGGSGAGSGAGQGAGAVRRRARARRRRTRGAGFLRRPGPPRRARGQPGLDRGDGRQSGWKPGFAAGPHPQAKPPRGRPGARAGRA